TPSGKGLTDIVNAMQSFGKKGGGNDVDVFAVTPKTDLEVMFTMSWAEKDVNLDMYLTDSAGNFILAAYKISGDVNPEFMGTAAGGRVDRSSRLPEGRAAHGGAVSRVLRPPHRTGRQPPEEGLAAEARRLREAHSALREEGLHDPRERRRRGRRDPRAQAD